MTSEHLATALAAVLAMAAIASTPEKPASFPERMRDPQSTATPAVQGETTPDVSTSDATASEHEAVEPLAVSLPQQLAGVTRRETWPTSDLLEIAEVPSKGMANHTQPPTLSATCANGQCFAPSRGYQYQRRRAAILPWRR